jgi:hypothetical protein
MPIVDNLAPVFSMQLEARQWEKDNFLDPGRVRWSSRWFSLRPG